jgi:hypothetical protein
MNSVPLVGLVGSWYFSWATRRLRNVFESTPGRSLEDELDESVDDDVSVVDA